MSPVLAATCSVATYNGDMCCRRAERRHGTCLNSCARDLSSPLHRPTKPLTPSQRPPFGTLARHPVSFPPPDQATYSLCHFWHRTSCRDLSTAQPSPCHPVQTSLTKPEDPTLSHTSHPIPKASMHSRRNPNFPCARANSLRASRAPFCSSRSPSSEFYRRLVSPTLEKTVTSPLR